MEFGNALGSDMLVDNTQGGQRTAHLKSGLEGDWYHFWWQAVTVDVPTRCTRTMRVRMGERLRLSRRDGMNARFGVVDVDIMYEAKVEVHITGSKR
jgi:hypothetical protein